MKSAIDGVEHGADAESGRSSGSASSKMKEADDIAQTKDNESEKHVVQIKKKGKSNVEVSQDLIKRERYARRWFLAIDEVDGSFPENQK